MAMAAMGVVFARGFSGVGYPKKKSQQGVAGVVFKKTPVFVVQLPKLDHMTVSWRDYVRNFIVHETPIIIPN
jgi:hypothetical protein